MVPRRRQRDPRHWERPDECDIARKTIGHAAFTNASACCRHWHKAAATEKAGPPPRRYNGTLRGLANITVMLRAA